jgi:putative SOS response-associated peptidase YedK
MCGRYRLGRGREAFLKYFGADEDDFDWSPRFNIAPTQQVPTIRQNAREPKRVVSTMRWGLIPFWAKDASIGSKMINGRSETAASKPPFREPFKQRRCLIPADGFYEWKKLANGKQPYCFQLIDEAVFAFAGIWDRWKNSDGRVIESCSILTTTPNAVTADVHDRMPVILAPDVYDLWLDPGFNNPAAISELLTPLDAGLMHKFPVSTRVNVVKNDDPSVSNPLPMATAAG